MDVKKTCKKVLIAVLIITFGLLMARMYDAYTIPKGIRLSNALRPIEREVDELSFGTTMKARHSVNVVEIQVKILKEEDFEKVIARCQELFTTEKCLEITKAADPSVDLDIWIVFSSIMGEKGPVEYTLIGNNGNCYIPDEKDTSYRKENFLVWHEGEDLCPIKPEGTE